MTRVVRKERVELGPRSYDIVIGPGVLAGRAGRLVRALGEAALVVSNRRVFGLYGGQLGSSLSAAGVEWGKILLPDGERYKTMASVGRVHDRLVAGRYGRDAVVIALGGGVIGDIAGFAAATYMRGVRVAQAPTTLLAQVDSSVGGKTGVNHPKGKNLIGAFHQPSLVMADTATLKTLPAGEILGGAAEVIKYGCIADARFFKFLEGNIEKLVKLEPKTTARAVRTSCRIKAAVVAEDEREAGRRAILNFGHTVGHAIEAVTGYKKYRHGHAVAMGMRAAAALSRMKGTLTGEDEERIARLIERAGLPASIPRPIGEKALVKAMEHDKKVKAGSIRFALLRGIGRCEIRGDVTRSEIREAIRRSRRKC
ncbi:MAG: 3-dehydroquinate synthase [Candidatus Nitrospinota bacterium M3_3B_026]